MAQIVTVLIGVVLILIGISNRKGNISMLHSYHRKRVTEEDRLTFGKTVGNGMILMGISLIVAGGLIAVGICLEQSVYATAGMIVMGVGFAAGLGIAFYAMIKYNKGIF